MATRQGEQMTSFFISEDQAVETTSDGDAVLLAGGEIDFEASPRLRQCIFEHITPSITRVVLDLSLATFIDSTAIGVLVGASNRLHEVSGGSLAVICTDENVLRIFEIAGIDTMLTLYGSRDEAFAAHTRAG
jgi:anti-sigma B factor antagonist